MKPAGIPFQGTPTAEEARTIARCLYKANPTGSLLPWALWFGVISLIFGVWSFDLTTLNGFGWLAAGLTFIVTHFVLRGSGNRSAVRAIRSAPLVGAISDEKIRLESPDETIELPLEGNQVVERTDRVVVARVANGRRLYWICRSTFASPYAFVDASVSIGAAEMSLRTDAEKERALRRVLLEYVAFLESSHAPGAADWAGKLRKASTEADGLALAGTVGSFYGGMGSLNDIVFEHGSPNSERYHHFGGQLYRLAKMVSGHRRERATGPG